MKKILCFGDSNTWGHDPVDCSRLERRWTVMLRELLDGYEICEDGVCGRTTRYGEHDTNGLAVFKERYTDKDCDFDLLIIMLGTNDTLNEFSIPPSETAAALSEFVRLYREKHGEDRKIILVSPIHIKERALTHPLFGELYSETSVKSSLGFSEEIEKAARREGVYFMDAAKYAKASEIDGVHMTSSEHEKLAAALYTKISDIFA